MQLLCPAASTTKTVFYENNDSDFPIIVSLIVLPVHVTKTKSARITLAADSAKRKKKTLHNIYLNNKTDMTTGERPHKLKCLHSFVGCYSQAKTKQNKNRTFLLTGKKKFISKNVPSSVFKNNGQLENTELMDCCA